MKKILVVDDEYAIRRTLELHLTEEGYAVSTVGDGLEGATRAKNEDFDLVLLDLRLPTLDGLEVLQQVQAAKPGLPVIVITAYDDMQTAVEAIRLGAMDHLGKPLDIDHLDEVIRKAFAITTLSEKGVTLCDTPEMEFAPHMIVGRSRAMKSVYKNVGAVADSKATVLIQGESGTGKELVARALHFNGRFRSSPFLPVVCSALAPTVLESELFGHEKGAFTGAYQRKPGKFELAQGGTLFLDEISEVSPEAQVRLLRFLQEREFERVGGLETIRSDVRVSAATNRTLASLVAEGRFRQDLYYRLCVVTIQLPPLRERMEDVPLLVPFFLERIRRETGKAIEVVPRSAMEALLAHAWPGNVRELENALRRAMLLSPGKVLLPETLQLNASSQEDRLPLQLKPLDRIEKEHIENVLAYTGYEKKRAAEILDVSRPTLDKRIRAHAIRLPPR
ncbi:MAG: sigma-54-dependent Fis family transcriptional regulator [Deltaproteobacteria bacterium]|nr:sigma-54-dependent Fis family transcriptional regulator [Deltaproteobacteria bacterium]